MLNIYNDILKYIQIYKHIGGNIMATERAENKKRGPKAYNGATFLLNFGKEDKEIYRHLQNKRHKSEYIRDLIAQDMKRGESNG